MPGKVGNEPENGVVLLFDCRGCDIGDVRIGDESSEEPMVEADSRRSPATGWNKSEQPVAGRLGIEAEDEDAEWNAVPWLDCWSPKTEEKAHNGEVTDNGIV